MPNPQPLGKVPVPFGKGEESADEVISQKTS